MALSLFLSARDFKVLLAGGAKEFQFKRKGFLF